MNSVKKALLELEPGAKTKGWFSENVESAARGFQRLGYQIKGFKGNELHHAPLSRKTIVKGSIHTVRTALYYLGLSQPDNIDIPDSLMKYTHRNIWKTTLGQIRERVSKRNSVFIKPADVQKGFRGHVMNLPWDAHTFSLPDSYKVLASEVVDFETEWRVYVLNREILGVRSYEGEWVGNPPPSKSFLKRIIEDYKEAPASYAIDVGKLVRPGQHHVYALIEVNEGFALGNYGIPHIQYARMVEARWKELTNT